MSTLLLYPIASLHRVSLRYLVVSFCPHPKMVSTLLLLVFYWKGSAAFTPSQVCSPSNLRALQRAAERADYSGCVLGASNLSLSIYLSVCLSLSLSLTHSLSLSLSHTPSLSLSLSPSPSPSLPLSLLPCLPHSITYSLPPSLPPSRPQPLPLSLARPRCRAPPVPLSLRRFLPL